MHESEKFEENSLCEWFEILDPYLASMGIEISSRPLDLCRLLIEDEIIISPREDDGDYIDTDWFGVLIQYVERWYERRYGVRFRNLDHHFHFGSICIYGTPYLVRAPAVIVTYARDNEKNTCYFPRGITDEEDVLKMIVDPPNFEIMNDRILSMTKRSIYYVVGSIRSIYLDIERNYKMDQNCKDMINGLLDHLKSFSRQFSMGCVGSHWSAYWELQLAVEKVLKVYLFQYFGGFKRTHDLKMLYNDCGGNSALGFSEGLISVLPSSKEVVDMRYYGHFGGTYDMYRCYKVSLSIVKKVASRLKRRFGVGGKGLVLYFKKPSWR